MAESRGSGAVGARPKGFVSFPVLGPWMSLVPSVEERRGYVLAAFLRPEAAEAPGG